MHVYHAREDIARPVLVDRTPLRTANSEIPVIDKLKVSAMEHLIAEGELDGSQLRNIVLTSRGSDDSVHQGLVALLQHGVVRLRLLYCLGCRPRSSSIRG
jgi:hypothetical protein